MLFSLATDALATPAPPSQPTSGPGGSSYSYSTVLKKYYGAGASGYWIFEPSGPSPTTPLPLIVFNHGWNGTNPQGYGAWLDHLVRRGAIVVYPTYQEPGKFVYPPNQITPNAVQAVKDALMELQSGHNHAPVNLEWFAIVGHSAGGMITANMASLAPSTGLPRVKAVMVVEPGKSWSRSERVRILLEDMSRIPAGTLLLTVVGDADRLVRDVDAKKVFLGSSQVSGSDKDYVIMVSDDHGQPALKASHFAPAAKNAAYNDGLKREPRFRQDSSFRKIFRARLQARSQETEQPGDEMDQEQDDVDLARGVQQGRGGVDSLDYYGFWKLFDALTDAAFYGRNREYALGNTPQQRFMGFWSDGVPVKELLITDQP